MNLLTGLDALHACDITHGDIKLENVLVAASDVYSEGFIVKIADFSHCVNDSASAEENWILGTVMWAAPEVRSTVPSCFPLERRKSCDIFSFGLAAWDCFNNGGRYFELGWIGSEKGIEAKVLFLNSLPKDELLRRSLQFIDSLGDMSFNENEKARELLSQSIRDDWEVRGTTSSLISAIASKEWCVTINR